MRETSNITTFRNSSVCLDVCVFGCGAGSARNSSVCLDVGQAAPRNTTLDICTRIWRGASLASVPLPLWCISRLCAAEVHLSPLCRCISRLCAAATSFPSPQDRRQARSGGEGAGGKGARQLRSFLFCDAALSSWAYVSSQSPPSP